MLRLAAPLLLVALTATASHAQPATQTPPRSLSSSTLDLTVGFGGMADAPTDVDGATLRMLDPDGFDTTGWRNTSAWRLRALAGARVRSDPSRDTTFVGRAAAGLERVSLSTTQINDDGPDNDESGADLGPAVELSGGFLYRNEIGLELAVSYVAHDGASVSYHRLDYDAIAVELRIVVALSL